MALTERFREKGDWAARQGLALFFSSIVSFYVPVVRESLPAKVLIGVNAVVVAEETMGKTLHSAWYVGWGCFWGSALAFVSMELLGKSQLSIAVQFVVLSFFWSYLGVNDHVKKFALMNGTISLHDFYMDPSRDWLAPFRIACSTEIGCLCAIAALAVPFPGSTAWATKKSRVACLSVVSLMSAELRMPIAMAATFTALLSSENNQERKITGGGAPPAAPRSPAGPSHNHHHHHHHHHHHNHVTNQPTLATSPTPGRPNLRPHLHDHNRVLPAAGSGYLEEAHLEMDSPKTAPAPTRYSSPLTPGAAPEDDVAAGEASFSLRPGPVVEGARSAPSLAVAGENAPEAGRVSTGPEEALSWAALVEEKSVFNAVAVRLRAERVSQMRLLKDLGGQVGWELGALFGMSGETVNLLVTRFSRLGEHIEGMSTAIKELEMVDDSSHAPALLLLLEHILEPMEDSINWAEFALRVAAAAAMDDSGALPPLPDIAKAHGYSPPPPSCKGRQLVGACMETALAALKAEFSTLDRAFAVARSQVSVLEGDFYAEHLSTSSAPSFGDGSSQGSLSSMVNDSRGSLHSMAAGSQGNLRRPLVDSISHEDLLAHGGSIISPREEAGSSHARAEGQSIRGPAPLPTAATYLMFCHRNALVAVIKMLESLGAGRGAEQAAAPFKSASAALLEETMLAGGAVGRRVLRALRERKAPASLQVTLRLEPARLRAALKQLLAMCIAASISVNVWPELSGYAPITVAFISGGHIGGAFAKSILRVQGTVFGGLMAYFLIEMVQNTLWLNAIFHGLWGLLSGYVRSDPISGYSGTVSAFTASLVMIGWPEQPGAQSGELDHGELRWFTMNRLSHTFIGISCFVLVEFTVWPQRSTTLARAEMKKVLSNISTALRGDLEAYITVSCADCKKRALADAEVIMKDIERGAARQKLFEKEARLEPVLWRRPYDKDIHSRIMGTTERLVTAMRELRAALLGIYSSETVSAEDDPEGAMEANTWWTKVLVERLFGPLLACETALVQALDGVTSTLESEVPEDLHLRARGMKIAFAALESQWGALHSELKAQFMMAVGEAGGVEARMVQIPNAPIISFAAIIFTIKSLIACIEDLATTRLQHAEKPFNIDAFRRTEAVGKETVASMVDELRLQVRGGGRKAGGASQRRQKKGARGQDSEECGGPQRHGSIGGELKRAITHRGRLREEMVHHAGGGEEARGGGAEARARGSIEAHDIEIEDLVYGERCSGRCGRVQGLSGGPEWEAAAIAAEQSAGI